ncbi:hypothetical protein E2C01_055914 [Portunus trituberculatus]|uniref:Uncharacterized protein n=1 Tax=Portunus trituberculatus TaxID=210409 RepID=A0A5B7GXF3_PORTR|nr:hypothetical protein [Portunus trituberculatus]
MTFAFIKTHVRLSGHAPAEDYLSDSTCTSLVGNFISYFYVREDDDDDDDDDDDEDDDDDDDDDKEEEEEEEFSNKKRK